MHTKTQRLAAIKGLARQHAAAAYRRRNPLATDAEIEVWVGDHWREYVDAAIDLLAVLIAREEMIQAN